MVVGGEFGHLFSSRRFTSGSSNALSVARKSHPGDFPACSTSAASLQILPNYQPLKQEKPDSDEPVFLVLKLVAGGGFEPPTFGL